MHPITKATVERVAQHSGDQRYTVFLSPFSADSGVHPLKNKGSS